MMQMDEEQEAILEFSENYPNYYVQSPSSVSHANYIIIATETQLSSDDHNPDFLLLTMPKYNHSPLNDHDHDHDHRSFSSTKPLLSQDNNMSRCSSSRASTTSFKNNNNVLSPIVVGRENNNRVTFSTTTTIATNALKKAGRIDDEKNEEEEWYNYDENNGEKSSIWQYLSFNTYPSSYIWIGLQLLWRFLFSLMLALLVFYIVTKPPPPHVSLEVTGLNQFELTQGVDLTGVATTLLSCNISMGLIIDNKSKVFGLHVLSPVVNVYFGRVPFILSQGERLYVKSREWREMEVYAGTRKKAMYGGGRNMEDMLNSGRGLPLLVTLTFSSYFRVIASLIHSDFHHHAQCLLILQSLHDKKKHHITPTYNTTCFATP